MKEKVRSKAGKVLRVLGWTILLSANLCQVKGEAIEDKVPLPRYFVDVERYRFASPDLSNSDFYPVPQTQVTRETYRRILDGLDWVALQKRTHWGMDGPRHSLPLLVRYVESGEKEWGEACIRMLKSFHEEMQRQVKERKWFWQFEDPAVLIPLYRKYLIQGGAMTSDAEWFREMWLYYCRNLHVWDSEPVEWRGGCHRSMPEAYSKGLAAKWYPDIPEAAGWSSYSQKVFQDFWRAKDAPQNDTGYMMGPLIVLIAGGDQWTGDNRVYVDPDMKPLWERLLVEITPDGAINPYGPNGGWNSTADYRIAMLERLSSQTRDGRYRWGAHKLLNYLYYEQPGRESGTIQLNHWNTWLIALAWLFADETVQPEQPDAGSLWTLRKEAARIPHTNKQILERLLGGADPRENFGHLCCSWWMSGKQWPDKLVLRSGWNSGDFFALIELHPTSFPANPGGIMGMNRWGSPFTQIVTSKGASTENRLFLEDIEGKATKRFHSDSLRIDEFWRSGTMPDIRSSVSYFRDTDQATFAVVEVENMDGLPVRYRREFVFVKNRFLATREQVTFEEGFKVRLGPIWNTQNIGPQIGSHWANTFMSSPVAENGTRSRPTPPVDLLVWFAPREGFELNAASRFETDPRSEACPNQLQYQWEGPVEAGESFCFTQVYYPHMPFRARATSNNPNPNARAAYQNAIQASAGASGIFIEQDDVERTVLRMEWEEGLKEWVVFNPGAEYLEVNGVQVPGGSFEYIATK